MDIIYRRGSISIAYTDGQTEYGSNFNVWYGYSDRIAGFHDIIINTETIKEEMKEDLSLLDHTCISVGNVQDITMVMYEVGYSIFCRGIKKHILLEEVIVENCYEDYVVFNKKGPIITRKYLHDQNLNSIYFLSDNRNRISLYGQELSLSAVSYRMPLSTESLINVLSTPNIVNLKSKGHPIISLSDIDIATNVCVTTFPGINSYKYYTITCVEHFAHQLQVFNYEGKCNNLHGHSYLCNVKVEVPYSIEGNKYFFINLDHTIRKLLKSAFLDNLRNTTCENIVSNLSHELCNLYKVISIELKETDNIKAIRYFESAYGEKDND